MRNFSKCGITKVPALCHVVDYYLHKYTKFTPCFNFNLYFHHFNFNLYFHPPSKFKILHDTNTNSIFESDMEFHALSSNNLAFQIVGAFFVWCVHLGVRPTHYVGKRQILNTTQNLY